MITRTLHRARADRFLTDIEVAFDEYSVDVVETSSLSCCLAAKDYPENINACVEDTIDIDEYTFD